MHTLNIAGTERSPLVSHYGSIEFDASKFLPVKNGKWVKPEQGGLWTSPVDSSYGWKDWNEMSDYMDCEEDNSFVLRLNSDAKIFVIDSLQDLKNAPLINGWLDKQVMDFEAIAKEYNAIWLTVQGETKTRMSHPLTLYGWDCESVLILNTNCFTQVK